ncbi:hypothetical protein RDWZM_006486 [Blomia tropicalis]|uniref:RING-type domain-containing protein n=1 Tax=Blomia tropicalis TaxID=40697 RepID=A0A9Q0RND6_BLOTA|nr:hypothetical protein RDWZM_006486 [Blomia tropicalis]
MSNNSPQGKRTQQRESDSESNRCPICLETIERRATAYDCGHQFCYDCISQWMQQRNRCPLCRQVVRNIRYTERRVQSNGPGSSPNVTFVQRDEPITPPSETLGYIVDRGFFSMVLTPADSPLYSIIPIQMSQDSLLHRYMLRMFEPDRLYMVPNMSPGTLYVLPDALEQVQNILHSVGITQIESDIDAMHENFLSIEHVRFFDSHQRHDRTSPS